MILFRNNWTTLLCVCNQIVHGPVIRYARLEIGVILDCRYISESIGVRQVMHEISDQFQWLYGHRPCMTARASFIMKMAGLRLYTNTFDADLRLGW